MRRVFMGIAVLALAVVAIGAAGNAQAAISYSTAGSVYSENFNNSLPTTTNPYNGIAIQFNGSAHIQNGNAPFPGGWKDDSPTDATYLGIPGWYLWSDISTLNTTNGGYNSHAQFRYGGGNPTIPGTGFFAFSTFTPNGVEKALGIRSASVFTNSNAGRRSYIGLQLINDTLETLTSFTITYDGEQYSESASNLGPLDPDGFDLQWSLGASAAGWHDSLVGGGFYNGTNGVNYGAFGDSFRSPINNITIPTTEPPHTPGVNLDGNFAGNETIPANNHRDITHTVSGIEWAPGAELWIRWRDMDAHDGIAIDNVRFTASVAPPVTSGDINDDGVIDAADYVAWRKGFPEQYTEDDYDGWFTNFGTDLGGGESGAVPEPSTLLCAAFAVVFGLASRRKR